MYGFSRGFSTSIEKKESEWQRWHIIETDNLAELEYNLMKVGCAIDVTSASRAA